MKKNKFILMAGLCLAGVFAAVGCGNKDTKTEAPKAEDTKIEEEKQPETILIAAAASLEYSMTKTLIPMFEKENSWITVEGTYDSSGKLQTQIESGVDADIFFSAASKQMNALAEKSLVDKDSVKDMLENKIVLIVPNASKDKYQKFEDVANAGTVAVGDPESVPAGQYAREALTSLNLWDKVSAKASLGTNVTEVLNWVSEGSAEAGIVYATDAAAKKDSLTVVAEAPEGSLGEKVLYPAGIVTKSSKKEAAQLFLDFLSSQEAAQVFEEYGFTPVTK